MQETKRQLQVFITLDEVAKRAWTTELKKRKGGVMARWVDVAAAKNVHLNRLINIISLNLGFLADGQLRVRARARFLVCEMNIMEVNYNWEKSRANISTGSTRKRCGEARRKKILLSLFEGILVVRQKRKRTADLTRATVLWISSTRYEFQNLKLILIKINLNFKIDG